MARSQSDCLLTTEPTRENPRQEHCLTHLKVLWQLRPSSNLVRVNCPAQTRMAVLTGN